MPVSYLRELAAYWACEYDWRANEASLNAYPQFLTTIDGTQVHFLHVRSAEPRATPLLLLHGFARLDHEITSLIGPLTDPVAYGGDPADAFHLVIPSLPGYGFSGPLTETGWTDGRTAALAELMDRLGYRRYGVQGGDVGAFIAPLIGRTVPDRVIGLHLNSLVTFPTGDPADMAALTEADRARLAAMQQWQERSSAYMQVQGTRPQTIAHALNDSPAGLLAWIVEKFQESTDPAAALPEDAVDRDRILTDVSIYWFTGNGRMGGPHLLRAVQRPGHVAAAERSAVPVAVAVFTTDVTVRRFAEHAHNVVRWTEFGRGGHFAAMEAPDLLTADLREFFPLLHLTGCGRDLRPIGAERRPPDGRCPSPSRLLACQAENARRRRRGIIMLVAEVGRFGAPEVLTARQVPDPVAGPGQVVVRTSAADVLFLDALIRSGRGVGFFPLRPPYVPGNGVAGQVISGGDGPGVLRAGRAVVAYTGDRAVPGATPSRPWWPSVT